MTGRPIGVVLVAAVALASTAVACGSPSDAGETSSPPTVAPRPSSTAELSILEPENGSVVRGSTVHVRLRLQGAHVVKPTSMDLQPDEGHLHLLLDGTLVSMNYGLDEAVPDVDAGKHLLQVEFVANDHAPFDPRVVAVSSFRVRP